MKQKIIDIANQYPSHIKSKIKSKHPDLYENVLNNYSGDKFTEKLYKFVYDNINNTCNLSKCKEDVEFLSFIKGYRQFCSHSHASKKEALKEEIECENCNQVIRKYKSESKKYCSHECYIEDRSFDKQLQRAREECKEKYGSMGFGVENIENSIRKKMKKRYGDEYYNNREASKRTKKERHGDENYNNIEKMKETKKEKYGDKFYSNVEQTAKKKKENKYDKLVNSNKFASVSPLFESDEYEGIEGYKKYPFECNKCGEEFEDHLYSGNVPRCPNCYDGWNYVGGSEAENEVYDYINSIVDCNVIQHDQSLLNGNSEIDIYVPEKNLAIEYDGILWHSEEFGGKARDYHLKKTNACENQNVQLLHVFEDEWKLQQDIVKSRLRHILGKSLKSRIYGRECDVKEIGNDIARPFLEKTHIQGAGRSKVKFGLFHGKFFNSNLVGVMTFGTPSVAQGHKDSSNVWEMKRFATSHPVIGGAGKLFKHFVRSWNPSEIMTYADRRWSTTLSNVYEKIGFDYVSSSNPNYFYFHYSNPLKRYHRFNFRKSVLDDKLEDFDPDLTEWENMQWHGCDRIWDCGHMKYQWKE